MSPTSRGPRAFYDGVLGLTLTEDTPIALVFDAHGTTLRVTLVEGHMPLAGTTLGWQVDDIAVSIGDADRPRCRVHALRGDGTGRPRRVDHAGR